MAESKPTNDPAPAAPTSESQLIYRSEKLFAGRREVWIEHGNDMYRLRLTQQNRLILTK
jgi:hemin uptake protein HemP